MQGTFPLRNSRFPAHSMSSSAKHTTEVWLTSPSVWPPHWRGEGKQSDVDLCDHLTSN